MRQSNNLKASQDRCRFTISVNGILITTIALMIFTCCCGVQDVHAQIDAGNLGGGAGIDTGTTNGGATNNIGTGGTTGTGGGDTASVFGNDENFGSVLGGVDTADERNQGFVGATGELIQQNGFVGPPGEDSGPPLSDDGSFGGGVNDVGGGTGGGGGGAGGGQNRNTGFGAAGQQGIVKGFEVLRNSVRANLRPQFASPQVSSSQIVQRFQNRIRQQPSMGNDGGGIQISIEGTTATMVGYAQSAEESNRVERQLRLEPGVYRINNETQILNR